MKAVILAGGKGTRLKNLTKSKPKALIEVSGQPIIEYGLKAMPSIIDEVLIVIGYLGNQIKNYIGDKYNGLKIKYHTLAALDGTYQAMKSAEYMIGKDKFLLIYGDDIYDRGELEVMTNQERSFGLAGSIPQNEKYLSIKMDSENNIIGHQRISKEDLDKKIIIGTGAFILDKGVFNLPPVKISNGEYGLPQTILESADKYKIKGFLMRNWIHINTIEDIKKAEKIITK